MTVAPADATAAADRWSHQPRRCTQPARTENTPAATTATVNHTTTTRPIVPTAEAVMDDRPPLATIVVATVRRAYPTIVWAGTS